MDTTEFITQAVRAVVPDAEVHPVDLTGGGDHWFCVVVSESFEGERSFRRQRPILDAFTPHFRSGVVHALDIKCLTPAEVESKHGGKIPAPFSPHDDSMPGMHPRG
jgi:acid stress-induced BolA-like protein IbaG/YrbA